MRKFLLTLLFIVFANPVFAEDIPTKTKPTKKQNIQIKISAETSSSMEKISKNFNTFRNNNICNNEEVKTRGSIELNEDFQEQLKGICNSAKTIKDIYNCVCEPTGNFYTKLKPVIEFKSLSEKSNKKNKDENLTGKFKKVMEYYDALKSISEIQTLSDAIKDTLEQHQRTEAELENEKNALIDKFVDKLKKLLKEERNRRNDLNAKDPDIVKKLTCNDPACLEKHNAEKDADINDWVVNNIKDDDESKIKSRIKKYIENVIANKNFKDNSERNNYLRDISDDNNETEPEVKKTIDNIKKLRNAEDKDKSDRDSELEKLAEQKDKERNLLKQIVDTINSAGPKINANLPESITTDNCNSKDTNDKLNKLLDTNDIKKSLNLEKHPSDKNDAPDAPQAKTVQDIKDDVKRTIKNNEELNKRLNEIQTEQVSKKFDRIKELLHQFNMLECTIYGQIDDIVNQSSYPFVYKRIGASGTKITPLGETKCEGLNPLTITAIQAITNTDEKKKWLDCLDKKAEIIDNNIKSMEKYIKDNFNKKYPNCKFECVYEDTKLMDPLYSGASDLKKYELWYNTDGSTIPGYKNPTNKITIEKQVLTCEIDSYQCPDRTITLTETEKKNAKSKEDLRELCEKKKLQKDKDDYKNNYDCKDDKGRSLPENEITKIKTALNKFDNENINLQQLKTEGDRLCNDANEQLKKQRYIDNYTCDDLDVTDIKAELQGMLDNSNPKPTLQALQHTGTTKCDEAKRNAKQKAIDEFICTYEGEVLTDKTDEIKRKMNDMFDTFADAKAIKDFGKDECDKAQQYQREQAAKAAEIETAKDYLKSHINDMCKVYEHCKHSITNEYGHDGPQTGNSFDQSGEFKDENYTNPKYLSYNNSVVIPYAEKIFIIYKNLGNKPINDLITEEELKNNEFCRLIGVNHAETVTGKVFYAYLKTHPRKPARGGGYKATYPNAEIIVNINK